ncbi:MAG TPA: hypothetical protein VE011_02005 [Candidatus Dormibacteraeota bacterium]|nr:hypothetical protein [Candidatus Dormibacteraeota bacterium]
MKPPLDGIARFLVRPIIRNGRIRIVDAILIFWFMFLSGAMIVRPILDGLKDPIGMDAIIYTTAARALVAGADPWHVQAFQTGFAAPPPSLIPYLALAWLPDVVVGWLGVGIAFISAVYAIHHLRLPVWWLLFPPTVLGIAAGSSALPMLALLVRGGAAADALAVATRAYAILPLVSAGRWRGLLVGALVIAISAPLVAWPNFVSDRDHVALLLAIQSNGGLSATAVPLLVPFAGVLLVLIGRRRAGWLLVPALWPDAQLHYASIAMPVLAEMPVMAIALSAATPVLVVAGLVGQVVVDRLAGPQDSASNSVAHEPAE